MWKAHLHVPVASIQTNDWIEFGGENFQVTKKTELEDLVSLQLGTNLFLTCRVGAEVTLKSFYP